MFAKIVQAERHELARMAEAQPILCKVTTKKLLFVVKTSKIMAKVYEFLANGFEEVEALAPVDILRRGGMDVKTVSITGDNFVETSHGITIKTDLKFEDITDFGDVDAMLLPGGLPGATNLNKHSGLRAALLAQYERGKYVAAICAAPLVLGSIGILKGKRATCYPGFEKRMTGATYTEEMVTIDGNIITGKGPGASLAFGYAILGQFVGGEAVRQLQQQMMYLPAQGE